MSFYFRFRDSFILVFEDKGKKRIHRLFEKEIFEMFKTILEENEVKFKLLFKRHLRVIRDINLLKNLVEEYLIKRLKYNEVLGLQEKYNSLLANAKKYEDKELYTIVYVEDIHEVIRKYKDLIIKIEKGLYFYTVFIKPIPRIRENIENYIKLLEKWIEDVKREIEAHQISK